MNASLTQMRCTLAKFDKLGFSPLDEESVLLLFAADLKALDYQVDVIYGAR